MKKIVLFLFGLIASNIAVSQIYMANNCDITFFSASPLEDIKAINKVAKPVINTATGAIQIKIPIVSFKFEKPLMEEHFNENYMETEKFPDAFFKGKINDTIDWKKDGEYKVTSTGTITVHGIAKERTLNGTIIVKGGAIRLGSKFNIHIADHGVKVPSLYVKNIAEDVEVTIDAILEPYKKEPKK